MTGLFSWQYKVRTEQAYNWRTNFDGTLYSGVYELNLPNIALFQHIYKIQELLDFVVQKGVK